VELPGNLHRAIERLLEIARFTLQEHRAHMPVAIVHIMEGAIPIPLPFENSEERKTMVEYVKSVAVETHGYAVTVITSARVVDSRTKAEEECLVLATSVQGGKTHVMIQPFTRNADRGIIEFGPSVEGEQAEMPGQMFIFPEWDQETRH
jgi:hypothetical protein